MPKLALSPASAEVSAPRAVARWLPGLALAGALAWAAIGLARLPALQSWGVGALVLAIVLGMVVGNTCHPRIAQASAPGVALAKQRLLRLGIVLYGLRLTFQDIGHVGLAGVAIDAAVLCSTFALALWLGAALFGIDRQTAMLIGAGSSICGAAAVLATEPVVRARAQQVSVAVATVVVFGTLATFLYPALYRLNLLHGLLPMDETAYGLFAGSTIHEVAQVVAAGEAVGGAAADTAVIAKMVRVMMLAPFLLGLSFWLSRRGDEVPAGTGRAGGFTIPWFALGFIAMAGVNSLGLLPPEVVRIALEIDTALLALAMAALGLSTHAGSIHEAGLKPLALAALLFAWLMGGGLALNLLLTHWVS